MTSLRVLVRQGTPSMGDLAELSHQLGTNWRGLARRLMLTESTITELTQRYGSISERAYDMLIRWRLQEGSGATYQVLSDALSHPLVLRKDLAEQFCLSNEPGASSDSTVPPEILVQGREAVLAFQNAMRNGRVKVHRGRIMFIGQDGTGKTSLKKALLGIDFNPHENSTVGVEVDPSKFEFDVDQIKNWRRTELTKLDASQFSENIAVMVAKRLMEVTADQDLLEQGNSNVLDDVTIDETQEKDVAIDLDVGEDLLKNDVMKLVVEYLKHLKLEQHIKDEEHTLDLWDFAGQHVYYASHHVFLSPRALYVLVCNLSKDMDAEAEEYFVQGVNKRKLHNPNSETNLDKLLSWLVSVHNVRPADDRTVREYARPPVFIVGTHADEPVKDVKTMILRIQESLTGKTYQEHVIRPLFSVDNKKSLHDDGVQALRNKIMEVLKLEPYMGEELPIRWFHFEKVVEALVKKECYHMEIGELRTVIKKVCRIHEDKEVDLMLDFYHNLGVIVKHGSTVVLQAQWLIDLLKQLITVPPFDKGDGSISNCWDVLEKSGILEMKLVEHVFDEPDKRGLKKEDILDLMEQFGLIAKFFPHRKTKVARYFVPTQLTEPPPPELCEKKPSGCDPCLLYVTFSDGFVPYGLFPQLLSACIAWCSERGFREEPGLYSNGARFFIGEQSMYSLVLICRKRSIKVALTQMENSASGSSDTASKEVEPWEVRVFLDDTLAGFSKKLHWLRNLSYDWCVPCTVCHCDQHNCKSGCCTNEECLYLHPVHSSDKLIVCKRSPRDEIVKIPGLGKWFRTKIENEEQSEDNQLFAPDQIDATAERQSSTRTKRSQRNRETVGGRDQNDASVEKHSANRLKRPSCSSTGVPEVTVGGRALQSSTRKRKSSSATTQVTKRTRVTNVIDRVAFKEGKPSHRELDELAAKIGQKWDKLGIHLNISQDVLDEIAANAKDKPYRMLLRWRDESNSTTLYEDLYLALCHPRVGLNNVAKLFCRKETT